MLNFYAGKETTTTYIGSKGNVRKGSKGIRCYPKPEVTAYRVELQVNRPFLRELKLSPYKYPVNNINPFSYIEFRKPFELEGVVKLNDYLKRKSKSHSELAERIAFACLKSAFIDCCVGCEKNNCPHAEYGPLITCQISCFKQIKKHRKKLLYGVDYSLSENSSLSGDY